MPYPAHCSPCWTEALMHLYLMSVSTDHLYFRRDLAEVALRCATRTQERICVRRRASG
jgi:hypothetical protein